MLVYNYYRYYDPYTGRYITSDPIGLEGGLNTYAYVGGNPVNAIDPYGLCDSGYAWKSNGMRGECVPESEAGYLPGNAASDAANICPIPIVKGAVIAGTLGRSIIANVTKGLAGNPLFKSALGQFKNTPFTNAGRAVTKHAEYFGFKSTEALRKVYNTEAKINKLAANTLKDIMRSGKTTTGAGGRYPNGWKTITGADGRAASWHADGRFIGFRGVQ